MKSVLIYPFGKEAEPIVNHFKQLNNIYPVCLVGLNGWDDGRRHYYAEGEEIPLIYEFEYGYKHYDPNVIWFTDFRRELEFEVYYLPFIRLAVADGKEIITSTEIKKIISSYITNDEIRYYDAEISTNQEREVGNFLRQINTPVIYICGLYEGVGKFELQLMILKELRRRKISAVQIGTREAALEFGIYNIPLYMTNKAIVDKKKVLMLNEYLKELEENEKPELIVMGIPGELYSPSLKYVAGCGFLALDCFYATQPDILIVALPFENYSQNDLVQMSESIERKFGTKVDVFVRTNKRFLIEETELQEKSSYLTIDNKELNQTDSCITNLFELKDSDIESMMDSILSTLNGYGEIKSV